VVSTINGDANVPFYKELGNQGIKATDIPVVAFSVGEEELAGLDTKPLVGHLAAWNYFESIETPGQQGVHQGVAHLHQEPEAHADQRPDGSHLHRLQHVGEGGRVGAILERTIIRFLYGRPLETLLATWGLSLVLQQAVRTMFGATNRRSATRPG
jgi:hypothetical protein